MCQCEFRATDYKAKRNKDKSIDVNYKCHKCGETYKANHSKRELVGMGIFSWLKSRARAVKNLATVGLRMNYAPQYREVIEKYGNDKIVSGQCARKALASALQKIIKMIGTPEHDRYFHLSARFKLANGVVIIVDKTEEIRVRVEGEPDRANVETIPVSGDFTNINTVLENTKKGYESETAYFKYDMVLNNCQRFVSTVVRQNNLQTDLSWVNQKVSELLPMWARKIGTFFTSLKNRLNQLKDGYGMRGYVNKFGLPDAPPLSNFEIDEYMKEVKGYVPCRNHYAFKDGLYPDMKDPEYCVVNLDDDPKGAGTHWCAYARKGGKMFWYDSFGSAPPDAVVDYAKKQNEMTGLDVLYNDKQIQHESTANCGYWCILFLKNMAKGLKPETVLSRQYKASAPGLKQNKITGGSQWASYGKGVLPDDFDMYGLVMDTLKNKQEGGWYMREKNKTVAERYKEYLKEEKEKKAAIKKKPVDNLPGATVVEGGNHTQKKPTWGSIGNGSKYKSDSSKARDPVKPVKGGFMIAGKQFGEESNKNRYERQSTKQADNALKRMQRGGIVKVEKPKKIQLVRYEGDM